MESDRKNILKGYNMLLYFAGSMIMNDPTEECITDFWASRILKNLPITSANPRFIRATTKLRDSCSDNSLCKKTLSDDFFRLFKVKGAPLAPAYESVYISRQITSIKKTWEIRDFYKTYGWTTGFQGNIPDDHLGIELLFLTTLLEKYLALDDDPCCSEMKIEICRFIDQHLLSWVPAWNEDIQEYSMTSCYKGIGMLIHASIEDLYGILS